MEFETVIGLEIHVELSTKTKMFCGCSNDNFRVEPNKNVCPICMGFPGQLPVPNKEAVKKGILAALALNCRILPHSKFDRKNYFYPDLPSGFQISQYDEPLSEKGHVEIVLGGQQKRIGITRLHLENDAGKLMHTANGTLLDFNRAGKPLMEIVSDPDLRSAEEAHEYAETLQKLVRYCGSSDCDMEKGQMRFDASVSIRPKGDGKLYPRAEIKNLNSFKSLEAAIKCEAARQVKLWEEGTPQATDQTVGWNETKQETYLMREKESSSDYRYFPEPDIPPMDISEEEIAEAKKEIPESPVDLMQRLQSAYGVSEADARYFSGNSQIARLFEEVAIATKNPRSAAAFIGTILLNHMKESGKSLSETGITAAHLTELIKLVDSGEISNNAAKSEIFEEMITTKKLPAQIVKEKGLSQVSDAGELEAICQKAIELNPTATADVRAGKVKAMAAIVGTVMKESHGKANPKMVGTILEKLLLK
ncbi:MAG: Asp-tRNA(Asn)/Glu-tRNA(Gln) amidotransferase subunit GatB [Candidatus Gracilibacteria bacterium]|jgi:aspartyl-tRNA(Asn)/glutamyl-tRNA(Gln) amidotransferase subunit B